MIDPYSTQRMRIPYEWELKRQKRGRTVAFILGIGGGIITGFVMAMLIFR